jgi:hypothetical protein
MIELEISAIAARAHARQLRWLLHRSAEAQAGAHETAVDEIRDLLNEAEHLADMRVGAHIKEDRCVTCGNDGEARRNTGWRRRSIRRWLRTEDAWQLLHVADESLVAIAPDAMVLARASEIDAQARRWLGPGDPRLQQIAPLLTSDRSQQQSEVSAENRYVLACTLHAIHYTWDRSYARARSFGHLLAVAVTLLTLAMMTLVGLGMLWPASLPMCTKGAEGARTICASGFPNSTPGDVALVALIGAIAAGFSAVANVTKLRPLVDPYQTPMFQGLLKVPTGAFTAVLGVLAIEQGLQATAGLSSSQGGMLFLAFVFGYSQQLVTHFVDSYGAEIRTNLAGERTGGGNHARVSG